MSEFLEYDQIPQGNFSVNNGLTPEQAAIIKQAERLGSQLSDEQPELVVELARDTSLRYEDIARILMPSEQEQYPETAKKAIGFAVRALITDDEMAELTHIRRSLRMKERNQAMGSAAFLAHQQTAATKAWQNRDRPDVDAMLRGRGRTAWSDSEKEMLVKLLNDPAYQRKTGSSKDKPSHELIALELNRAFHDSKAIRYTNSVRNMRNEYYKQLSSS